MFGALLVSHLAGDFIAQTEFQAMNKHGGLGRDPLHRRALAGHAAGYLLCFVPAMIWLGRAEPAPEVAAVAAAVAVPHAVQDDGRLVGLWMKHVKRSDPQPGLLLMAVDQSFHVVALLLVAVVVGR